jgi:polyhydroxyalkanoate synthesis repressor PhaR
MGDVRYLFKMCCSAAYCGLLLRGDINVFKEYSIMARKPAAKSTPTEPEGVAPEGASTAEAQPQRVIKKYPNRRLYDTQTSSYVTLSEIKQLVMHGKPFVVRDAKSAEDLTRSVLLQIILEEESAGVPMFTEAVLANIIRFYGHAMQGHMGAYLESNLQSLMMMQSKMGHQQQNIMSQMQEQMQKQTAQFLSAFGLKS